MNSTVGNNMSKLHSSTALDLLFQNLNDLIRYQHLCVPPTVLTESQHVKHGNKELDRVFQLFPCLFFHFKVQWVLGCRHLNMI